MVLHAHCDSDKHVYFVAAITTTTTKVRTETGFEIIDDNDEIEISTPDINMPLELEKTTNDHAENNYVKDTDYEYKKKLFSVADFLLNPENFEASLCTTKESLTLNDEQVTESEEIINNTSPDIDTLELFTDINEKEKQKLYSVADELLRDTVKGDNEKNNTCLSVPKRRD